jgi:hypothetical protein
LQYADIYIYIYIYINSDIGSGVTFFSRISWILKIYSRIIFVIDYFLLIDLFQFFFAEKLQFAMKFRNLKWPKANGGDQRPKLEKLFEKISVWPKANSCVAKGNEM